MKGDTIDTLSLHHATRSCAEAAALSATLLPPTWEPLHNTGPITREGLVTVLEEAIALVDEVLPWFPSSPSSSSSSLPYQQSSYSTRLGRDQYPSPHSPYDEAPRQ